MKRPRSRSPSKRWTFSIRLNTKLITKTEGNEEMQKKGSNVFMLIVMLLNLLVMPTVTFAESITTPKNEKETTIDDSSVLQNTEYDEALKFFDGYEKRFDIYDSESAREEGAKIQKYSNIMSANSNQFLRMARAGIVIDVPAWTNIPDTDTRWTRIDGASIQEFGWYGKRFNNEVSWCIQLGVPMSVGLNDSYVQILRNDDFLEKASIIALYGYHKQPSLLNELQTQMMIWELQGNRLDAIVMGTPNYQNFKNEVNRQVNWFYTTPSFHNKELTLDIDKPVTITDTTGAFSNYKAKALFNTANIDYQKSGNQVTLTARKNSGESGKLTFEYDIPADYEGSPIVLEAPWTQNNMVGKVSDPTRVNIPYKVNLQGDFLIRKLDEKTGKPIPGMEMLITYPDGSTQKAITDNKGEFKPNGKWNQGTNIKVKEIKAPAGYVSHGEEKTVTIVANETTSVVFKNHTQKGLIKINKTKEAITSATTKETEFGKDYDFVTEQVNTEGAEFVIKNIKDKITADGTLHYKDGEIVGTLTTDKDGKAELPNLELGTYELIETKAPSGQVIDTTAYPFEFKYAGQEIEVVTAEQDVKNFMQEIEIRTHKSEEKFTKFEEEKAQYEIVESDNKTFGLFLTEAMVDGNGTEIAPADALIATANTVKGLSTSKEKIPEGKYYIQELKVDENHVLDPTKHEFEFDYSMTGDNGVYTIDIWGNKVVFEGQPENRMANLPIINDYIKGGLEFTKFDSSNGDTLAHVTFELLNEQKEVIITRKTDENGKIKLEKDELPKGKYFLREKHALVGYVLNQKLIPFEIKENGEIVTLEMKNDREVTKITTGKDGKDGRTIIKTLPQTGTQEKVSITLVGLVILASLVCYEYFRLKKAKETI